MVVESKSGLISERQSIYKFTTHRSNIKEEQKLLQVGREKTLSFP